MKSATRVNRKGSSGISRSNLARQVRGFLFVVESNRDMVASGRDEKIRSRFSEQKAGGGCDSLPV